MSYQVIARKWRPQSFVDLVGQDHITVTLQNALKNGRIPHAILFTGPRGTGKTSSARILAKALRCPNAVNFVPCNDCISCNEVSSSSSVDVIEIDGASNNGVDSIRELRETVGYMPAQGKYKIYIIDEVHMLSTSAFNALLKTLEEPPAHIIFIMATTEVHKIPQTILSRCQRFDFRRISVRQVSERLQLICSEDKITFDSEALWLIARQGDGSMRDSQSLLDQVITFANGHLSKETVQNILGLTDRELLYNTLRLIIHRNPAEMVQQLFQLKKTGIDPELFFSELIEICRHMLIVKLAAADSSQIIELPESEIERLVELSTLVSEEDIHFIFDLLLKASQDLSKSQDPLLVVEILLLRLAKAPQIQDLNLLIKSLADGYSNTNFANTNSSSPSSATLKTNTSRSVETPNTTGTLNKTTTAYSKPVENKPIEKSKPLESNSPTAKISVKLNYDSNKKPQENWLIFIDSTRSEDALFAAKIENLIFIKDENNKLSLGIPKHLAFLKDQMADPVTRKKLQSLIESFWGPNFSYEINAGAPNEGDSAQSLVAKKNLIAEDEIKKKILTDPRVLEAQKVFKGTIKSVTDDVSESTEREKK